MGQMREGTELFVLRRCWRRWVAILELFARRRRRRHRVDVRAYVAMHGELLAACRSLADSAGGTTRAFYQGLEDLARPWLTPRVLAKADREILFDLLTRCRRVEGELCGRSRARAAAVVRRSLSLLAALAALATAILLAWTAARRWSPVLAPVRGWLDLAWFSLKRSGEIEQLFVISLVVVAVSARVVSRAARE
jgi:hypothetical protein